MKCSSHCFIRNSGDFLSQLASHGFSAPSGKAKTLTECSVDSSAPQTLRFLTTASLSLPASALCSSPYNPGVFTPGTLLPQASGFAVAGTLSPCEHFDCFLISSYPLGFPSHVITLRSSQQPYFKWNMPRTPHLPLQMSISPWNHCVIYCNFFFYRTSTRM